MLRVGAVLPEELERTVRGLIGCCLAVHRELGPGLLEGIYKRALELEFRSADLSYAREFEVPIRYKGRLLTTQRLDFVIAGTIVLEVKSVDQLAGVHRAQVLSCLRASGLPVGLLVNFNEELLKNGLKRFVI